MNASTLQDPGRFVRPERFWNIRNCQECDKNVKRTTRWSAASQGGRATDRACRARRAGKGGRACRGEVVPRKACRGRRARQDVLLPGKACRGRAGESVPGRAFCEQVGSVTEASFPTGEQTISQTKIKQRTTNAGAFPSTSPPAAPEPR